MCAVLSKVADRLAALVDPDGEVPDEDRIRRRHVSMGRQQADGMSPHKNCRRR
jgi:Domain of unknown function (DUF222)